MVYFLEKFCLVPVIKAWGKKNPEIQKTTGVPSSYQLARKVILSLQSWIHEAKGLRDKKPTDAQDPGTWLSKMDVAIFSRSSDMTISPTRAFCTATSDYFIRAKSLLYLTHSWNRTVFIDCS